MLCHILKNSEYFIISLEHFPCEVFFKLAQPSVISLFSSGTSLELGFTVWTGSGDPKRFHSYGTVVSPSSPPLSLYNAACHKPLSTPQMWVLSCFLSFCAFLFCHLFPFPQRRSQQMSIVWFCWRSLH